MSSIKPREAEVVIYQGDDLARLAELRQAAESARRLVEAHETAANDGAARMGDAPSAEAEQDAYDAFVEEAADRALVVKLRAIGRRRFRALMAAHPPRQVEVTRTDENGVERTVTETHPDDAPYEVDTEVFPEALLTYVDSEDPDYRTIAAPEFKGSKSAQAFIDDELSEGDFDGMWITAYYLNRSPSADPKARRYSNASPRSNET
ncbi:MAG: hypothetical protein ACXWYG_03915 [Aeromicrobium sp.]